MPSTPINTLTLPLPRPSIIRIVSATRLLLRWCVQHLNTLQDAIAFSEILFNVISFKKNFNVRF